MKPTEETERSPEEAGKAAPFPFPSGAFEMEDLLKAGNAAAAAAPEKREEVLDKALTDANQKLHGTAVPGLEPGFKFEAVTREDLGVTETIQVRDPKATKALEKSDAEDEKAAETRRLEAEAEATRLNDEAAAQREQEQAANQAGDSKGAGKAGAGKE
jgi:hypothetical protein